MPAWNEAQASEIIRRHSARDGALLPILHDVQAAFGCVPGEAVPFIAEALNLTRAEVHGVVSFYHDFRDKPAGRHVLKLCRAEACQSMTARRWRRRCSIASTSTGVRLRPMVGSPSSRSIAWASAPARPRPCWMENRWRG
jgi:NADH:ubiquinone oxidoreductase subunit E